MNTTDEPAATETAIVQLATQVHNSAIDFQAQTAALLDTLDTLDPQ